MLKKIRIAILLFVLFLVGADSYLTQQRLTGWKKPLAVVIYPVNGDSSAASSDYIARLRRDDLTGIARFLEDEGERYRQKAVPPVLFDVAPEVSQLPPEPPFGAGTLTIMWWSLQLRYWAWKNDTNDGPPGNIKVFVLYHDPAVGEQLDHSLGLKEGHICLVNAYAGRSLSARNNVVIAHEILHTLGATDKYDRRTLQPLFPEGYAEPELIPPLPQQYAEIMGGAIPLSPEELRMPESLAATVVGKETAREIGWLP